jgi:hypothetical protein
MRTFILITVLGFGAFWAFDQYAFNGQHVRDAWQQAKIQSRSFSALFPSFKRRDTSVTDP